MSEKIGFWKGKPLHALTRDELVDALLTMTALLNQAREQMRDMEFQLVHLSEVAMGEYD